MTPQGTTDRQRDSEATARVERKDFLRTVRLHGAVEAVQSYSVIAPRLAGPTAMTMLVTKLVKNGALVKEGDVLVEFDRQNHLKTVLDREAEYEDLVQQIKRRQADQAVAHARDETELKEAEVQVQSALVDMRSNELVSSTQAEINKQNLQEAEARLKMIKDTLVLKRQAEAADLRILEIQRDRAQQAMVHAQSNIDKMTIKSPLSGMVVLVPVYRSGRPVDPQEGDEVRAGFSLLTVVNTSAMQVRARVNQVDMDLLRPGQPAEVRLDAYPGVVFPATLDRLGAVATAGYSSKQIRYFTAFVTIQGSNPKLLPDLTAAVDVEVARIKGALVVPREAIISRAGQTYVQVVQNEKVESRAIRISSTNAFVAVIESGIEEGTVIELKPQRDNPFGP